jgi:hypothetical protein
MHVYNADGSLDPDHIKFYYNESTVQLLDWDSIEKSHNNWFILKKTFAPGHSPIDLGLAVKQPGIYDLYIDAAQLEKSSFSSPYVESSSSDNGRLIIDRSLITKDRGVIHFRFRPFFDFFEPKADGIDYDHPPRILFESLGKDSSTGDILVDYGFRCQYYFDENRNRGIIEFSINGEDATWQLETVETYWYQWHTIAIVYDFNTNRYVFWFDYFNNIIDSTLSNQGFTFTDLYIGHGYPLISRYYSEYSADIEVKDIVILNFPISDFEILNWVQTYEFFNYSQVVNVMEDLERTLQEISVSVENLSSQDVLDRLDELEQDILDLQSGQVLQNNNITNNTNNITNHEGRISTVETSVGTSSPRTGLIGDVLDLEDDVSEIRGSTWANLPRANLQHLREDVNDNTNLINTEAANRIAADLDIRGDFASIATGQGASLIGVEDASGLFTTANVEAVLAEIAGAGRTTETIAQNAADIITNAANIATNTSDIATLVLDVYHAVDGDTGQWDQTKADNLYTPTGGYNIWDIKTNVDLIMTSTADGASGADNVAATAVGTGSATTVQGILEELQVLITSGGSTLDGVYENGSNVTVDVADVVWNLNTGRKFRIYDSTDTNKFEISEGSGSSSVKIDTSGGINIDAEGSIEIDTGSNFRITVDDSDITLGTTTSGSIILDPVEYVEIGANVIPTIAGYNIGASGLEFGEIHATSIFTENITATSNFVYPTITADPTDTPSAGTARFRTDTHTLWIYDGSNWRYVTLT